MTAIILLWWLIGMYSYAIGQNLINMQLHKGWKTTHVFKMPIIGIGGIFVAFWCALIVSDFNRNN